MSGGLGNRVRRLPDKVCPWCGTTFRPRESETIYCSNSCSVSARYYKANGRGPCSEVPWMQCSECEAWFVSRWGATVCSTECRKARARRLYQDYAAARKGTNELVCSECGNRFEAPYGDKRRQFCSVECGKRFNGRVSKHVRRGRLRGRVTERLDPLAVFGRDGWICGICGREVSKRWKSPDPRSASLDHIVPLSQGGSHTWGNVQCSHRGCNVAKSDRGPGQLRLAIFSGG
jgi:5-methylcytosine-specific restriction endonuclease McrA